MKVNERTWITLLVVLTVLGLSLAAVSGSRAFKAYTALRAEAETMQRTADVPSLSVNTPTYTVVGFMKYTGEPNRYWMILRDEETKIPINIKISVEDYLLLNNETGQN